MSFSIRTIKRISIYMSQLRNVDVLAFDAATPSPCVALSVTLYVTLEGDFVGSLCVTLEGDFVCKFLIRFSVHSGLVFQQESFQTVEVRKNKNYETINLFFLFGFCVKLFILRVSECKYLFIKKGLLFQLNKNNLFRSFQQFCGQNKQNKKVK